MAQVQQHRRVLVAKHIHVACESLLNPYVKIFTQVILQTNYLEH